MIGPVDLMNLSGPGNCRYQCLTAIVNDNDSARPALDGVVLGGESGPRARPLDVAWVRSVRDQCAATGVPFMFKQWSQYKTLEQGGYKENGFPLLDGRSQADLPWEVKK